jgi:hypothetical protein
MLLIALRRTFQADYLLEAVPGPLGRSAPLFYALIALLAVGLALSLVCLWARGSQGRRKLAWLEALLCALGILLTAARIRQIPILSMRFPHHLVVAAAIGCPLGYWLLSPSWDRTRQATLAVLRFSCEPGRAPLPWPAIGFLGALHALGVGAVWEFYGLPCTYALWSIPLLLIPQLFLPGLFARPTQHLSDNPPTLTKTPGVLPAPVAQVQVETPGVWPALYIEALTPLFLPYGVLFLRLVLVAFLRALDPNYQGFDPPEPWATVLSMDVALLLALGYVLLYEQYMLAASRGREANMMAGAGISLGVLSFAWAGGTYLLRHTHGVTGSDPYAYVQMAVDLARHSQPFHVFRLFPTIVGLGVPWWPIVHVGYNLPFDLNGTAASVWPWGHSLFLAIGYRLAGEEALYVTTPLLGLVALVAICALALEVAHHRPRDEKALLAGVSIFLLATSYVQATNTLVPMADVSSQLFTVLTMYLAWRGTRTGQFRYACPAGVAFGLAYIVRYTQLLLVFAVLLLTLSAFPTAPRRRARQLGFLALFGASALLVALPDFYYRQVAFGNPLRFGSGELQHLALGNIPITTVRMARELFCSTELGYMVPFLLYGLYQLYRERRRELVVLLAWMMPILLFHLSYAALRMRDLLSITPVLALCCAWGFTDLVRKVQNLTGEHAKGAKVFTLTVMAAFLAAHAQSVLPLLWDADFYNFGYLGQDQRLAFGRLGELTLADSVIGCSLNSGSVDLYGGRMTFRPAYWTTEELLIFIRAMLEQKRTVYLLDDGVELQEPLQALQRSYRLVELTRLPAPYFVGGSASINAEATLYEVTH